jgi:hypothetical protein
MYTCYTISFYTRTKLKNIGGITLFISDVIELISITTGSGVCSLGVSLFPWKFAKSLLHYASPKNKFIKISQK